MPLVAATVWLWTALGGLGARSRRGWGSLTLTKVEGPPGIESWQKLCRPAEGLDGLSTVQRQGALVADLGGDDRAGDRDGALGVVGAAELGAAEPDVLGDEGGAEAEEAAGAGVVRDGDAGGEEVLEALLGDLGGAVDGDVGDIFSATATSASGCRPGCRRCVWRAPARSRGR